MEATNRTGHGFPAGKPGGLPGFEYMPKRRVVLQFIYHALFLLAIYIIQAFVLPYVKALPSIPLILPLAAVGVAMFEGGGRGAVCGLFAGALCDLAMNQPIAQFTLMLTFICIVICVLSAQILAQGFLTFFTLCVGTLAVCAFMQMFALLFFDGVAPSLLLWEALRQGLVSLPFTVPIYFASRALRYV